MTSSIVGSEIAIRISPGYTVGDWKRLRMTTEDKSNWPLAVQIFDDRIVSRFLAPVDAIKKHVEMPIQEYCGFVVVAIDCLLIETLGQFYHGFNETPSYSDVVHNKSRLTHCEFYIKYLEGFHTLAADFDTVKKRKLFYQHFRCGLLHQGQTKLKSKIRYGEKAMVAFADAKDESQGLIVDRNRLHDALVEEFTRYKGLLIAGKDRVKRRNFLKKMNFIAS